MALSLDLTGKVVLVTGGTRGIGRGITSAFLQAGAHVVTCSRSEVEPVPGSTHRVCDVRDAEAVTALVDEVVAEHGRLDVLVNNAGGAPSTDAATASPRFHDKILALNLSAPLVLAQAANQVMQEQGSGAIVNISSISAHRPAPTIAAVASRFPRRTLLAVLAALFTVGTLASAAAPTFELVVVARFAAALPHGAYFGIAALVAALVWPLDAWGESLFSAHMAQHITLMGLAAPLLVLGQPLATMTRALPRGWQRRLAALAGTAIWRRGHDLLTATGVATALMLGVFLFWHAPPALAVALDDDLVHAVMHGSIFAAALAFWTMIARVRDRGFGVRIVALFVCFKFSLILGALLTFSGRALYPVYGSRPDAWGLTPVEDQQLAGVLMMTAAAMMYLVAALVVAAAWFASMDRTQAACNTVAAANGAGS
ncbi:MAG: SDR family NAD(P)-dependent oxidoreductase [Paracoccus sp. (in: a-proteobacteria)]